MTTTETTQTPPTAEAVETPDDTTIDTDEPDVARGLELAAVRRAFGAVKAVEDVTLDVPAGSFVSFLGPSGCGKTTLLRLIAGLDAPDAGRIRLDGTDITSVPSSKRNVGMVFQSLALFPHLDVAQNIGYSLRIRSTPKPEIAARVSELLELVDLYGLDDRRVSQLSGGQRQRVAIARALARKPALFLLDEPMSALDANLRESLQVELRLLQQKLGVTTIMVTHDQREAMTMSDLIVVMNDGRVEQIGSPLDVYRKPRTVFAARFMGTTNLLHGEATGPHTVRVGDAVFDLGAERYNLPRGRAVVVSARPGDGELLDSTTDGSGNVVSGTVSFVRDLGSTYECFIDAGHEEPLVVSGGSRRVDGLQQGDTVSVRFAPESCVVVTE